MTKLESGRSMVEMLGVLAIIGVLSIGGIAGYNMAMNRHKANNILAAASQLLVLAETGATPTLTSIGSPSLDCDTLKISGGIVYCQAKTKDLGSAVNNIVTGACKGTDNKVCSFKMVGGVVSAGGATTIPN